jgi:hypothetical protein
LLEHSKLLSLFYLCIILINRNSVGFFHVRITEKENVRLWRIVHKEHVNILV